LTKILRNYGTNVLIYGMKKYVLVQFLQKFAIYFHNIPIQEKTGVLQMKKRLYNNGIDSFFDKVTFYYIIFYNKHIFDTLI